MVSTVIGSPNSAVRQLQLQISRCRSPYGLCQPLPNLDGWVPRYAKHATMFCNMHAMHCMVYMAWVGHTSRLTVPAATEAPERRRPPELTAIYPVKCETSRSKSAVNASVIHIRQANNFRRCYGFVF